MSARDRIFGGLREMLFKFGWDTRCRSLDVARALGPMLSKENALLDAGCGDYGLADFMGTADVVGTDIVSPSRLSGRQRFFRASITSLPIASRSFPLVASVDVLEHLPLEVRNDAVAELVRVARTGVVVAFPCGARARQADEDFRSRLVRLAKRQPDWLVEHLQNPYPSVEWLLARVEAESTKLRRRSEARISYSERIQVTELLRWAATRSGLLYIGLNLLAGLMSAIVPAPNAGNSYRAIVLIRFHENGVDACAA